MQNSKLNDQKKKQDEKQIDNKEIEVIKTQNQELESQVKRILADYQNLEKRVAEQRKELILGANKDLLLRLLPVLDTLILASKHSEDKSLQIATQHFLDVLQNEGVVRIKTEGGQFDPNTMEAIGTASNAADAQEGEVIEETRIGYMIGDRVLRVAQVIVGKAKN